MANQDKANPQQIYSGAQRPPAVSLGTFCSRYRRLVQAQTLSAEAIEDALWLLADEYKHKYSPRRTWIDLDGQPADLNAFYKQHFTDDTVTYSNFWQRVRTLKLLGRVTRKTLSHALTLSAPKWKSFYGGGRRKGFVYDGEEYPEHSGQHFHSVAALLHTLARYDDRALVWSRLKAGWSLDDALSIPTAFAGHRSGSIYRVTRKKTGAVYVGLTVTSIEQRWAFHVRHADSGSTTKFHAAIRADGPAGFDVEPLETGIMDPALLPAREAYWVHQLNALGPHGLNSAKPGGLGSPAGKFVEYEGETFRSKEEAAVVLGVRLGMAKHVIRSRLLKGLPMPKADKVRRHSRHPEAGSNLFRRWKAMNKRHPDAVVVEWSENYDNFKSAVSPVPDGMELVRKRSDSPWGPENFDWVSTQAKVERVHGKELMVNGVRFPSLNAVARAHGIGVSTLKHRVYQQGVSVDQAIATPLSVTSYRHTDKPIIVDGIEFRSKRQAIIHIARTRGITEDQAKYRYSKGWF